MNERPVLTIPFLTESRRFCRSGKTFYLYDGQIRHRHKIENDRFTIDIKFALTNFKQTNGFTPFCIDNKTVAGGLNFYLVNPGNLCDILLDFLGGIFVELQVLAACLCGLVNLFFQRLVNPFRRID